MSLPVLLLCIPLIKCNQPVSCCCQQARPSLPLWTGDSENISQNNPFILKDAFGPDVYHSSGKGTHLVTLSFLFLVCSLAINVQLTQGSNTQRNLDTKMAKVRSASFYKCGLIISNIKIPKTGPGDTCLHSLSSEGGGRGIMSSRPAWATQQS